MNNSSKNLETICLLPEVNTIVDTVAILNKHIKLDERVEIAPMMNELRSVPFFKGLSYHNSLDAIESILKMRGLQCSFTKIAIERLDKKGAYPAIVVSKLKSTELPKEAKITIKIKIKHYD